ncbi:MAG: GTP 3',8-cyclase MoaA [Cellvibrionaceae bacterium]|nr:GTP 3',8-cyclase MoaA [Cellvibrionaceae bacterium]
MTSENSSPNAAAPPLQDNFGRRVNYLRLSVTDRCDFRCLYCMADEMQFMPKKQLISYEEILHIAAAFSALGVSKIRVSGGEPLIRKDVVSLLRSLSAIPGIEELCITTNGSHLQQLAIPLRDAGVSQVNISLDSLQPQRFKQLTRYGDLAQVLKGIAAASQAGFAKIKINTVLMRHFNLDEVLDLADFALSRNMDIRFIEEMPLGEVSSHSRSAEFISSEELKAILDRHYQLQAESPGLTDGPARNWSVNGYTAKVGFISPHSENFCASCNRVRLSASGRLLLCLGNEHSVDLKQVVRSYPGDSQRLQAAILEAMLIKPEQHHFDLNQAPQILRFMNATGG